MRSLEKYQTGGGSFRNASLRSSGTSFTKSWKPMGNSGFISSDPSIASPTRYSSMFSSPSSGQQSGGGGALGAVSSIVGMIGPAIQAGMSYASESERINEEKKKRSQYYQEQGDRNVMNYDRSMSGNVYGTYQTGGAYNPYSDLEKRDAELRGEGAMGLSTGITDTVINATPLGMFYGPAKQLYSEIASAYGSQRVGNEDGTSKEVFGMADDTQAELGAKGFLGNFMRPAHESAIQHWVNAAESDENVGENVGKGFLSLLTAGIYDGVQGISESQDWGAEQKRMAETSGTNVGGTSADLVNRGTEFQQGVNMRALRDQQLPMGKYGGSMNEYGKGGLYANIHAKRARIKAGSGEKMRSPGEKGAPTAANFERAAKTAKKQMGGSVPEYGASGMVEYGKGGIHIDPAKRGTFKAQASRMDMGVQEAASKILNAPEGEYSPEMRKKANFARNFAKETGGYLKQYMGGGMRPYQMGGEVNVIYGDQPGPKNAEVENNETIAHSDGSVTLVKGKPHEEGGVKLKLKEGGPAEGGDYVFSDHLKTQDPETGEIMSMAELHLKYKDDPRMMRWVMQTQEQLAGRAKGEGMDQMAKTGGLMKYQMGSWEQDVVSPKSLEYQLSQRKAATEADKVIPKSKTSSAQVSAASQNTVPVPQDMKSTVTPMEPYTQPMTMPQRTYQPSELSTADLLPKAPEKSRNANALLKYAPELALLASGAINAALVPRSYDLPEVPAMPQISYTDVKLDRADNRADRAEAQKNLSAYMNLVRSSGSGPGSMAMVQSMRDRIIRDLEQSSQNVRQMNLSAAAQEAKMNMEAELKRKLTNAEFKMIYDKLNLERGAALADFNIQRKNNIADAITAGVLGAAETYASQRYADAISGESGVGDRQLQNNDLLRGFYARINNKKERA